MPTVLEKHDKPCWMDIRLTQAQRARYERAAALRGQTLAQWTTSHLDEGARRDIAEATSTVLTPEGFDAFCKMLEEPMPQPMAELLNRKAVWE